MAVNFTMRHLRAGHLVVWCSDINFSENTQISFNLRAECTEPVFFRKSGPHVSNHLHPIYVGQYQGLRPQLDLPRRRNSFLLLLTRGKEN
jgi:hypothetical protein